MAKIHKFQGDITKEIANSFKESIALDTEATGLQIPERDKLSLIQICDQDGAVYIIQPDRKNYKAPNLVKVLEDETQKLSTIDCVANIPTLLNPELLFWSTNSFGDSTNVS